MVAAASILVGCSNDADTASIPTSSPTSASAVPATTIDLITTTTAPAQLGPVAPSTTVADVDPATEQAIKQGVQDFFAQFQAQDGSLLGGYKEYSTPQEFEQILSHQLRTEINLILQSDSQDQQKNQIKLNEGAFYAPIFDLSGHRRRGPPDIGAYEYRGR
jgi:hypothetical protein